MGDIGEMPDPDWPRQEQDLAAEIAARREERAAAGGFALYRHAGGDAYGIWMETETRQRCWCRTGHLPPFCDRPGLADRYRPPRWLIVAAMIMALLTAEAFAAVLLTAAIRLVTS